MRKLSVRVMICGLCMTVIAIAFCIKAPASPMLSSQYLRIALMTEPLTLDPRRNSDGITSVFLSLISEGLTRIGQDGRATLALAEQVHISEDKRQYTFLLKNSCWSNGKKITAYDFKESWIKALDPSYGGNPEYLFIIQHAKQIYAKELEVSSLGVHAPNENTLIITLEYPLDSFLELLANKIFYPVCEAEWVGAGPFKIKEWIHQDKIVLEKNPRYWDESSVHLHAIELYLIQNEMTQLSLFEQGKLDWIGSPFSFLPLDGLANLKQHSSFHTFSIASLYFCSFNTQKPPLNHAKLRKALTYALHRQELIDYISQGNEIPACAVLPFKMEAIHKHYFQDGDIHQACQLLQEFLHESDITKDELSSLTLSYPAIHMSSVMAQAIQQQWQNVLGIKIHLQPYEWGVFLNHCNTRNYDISLLGRGTYNLDPIYFLSLFKKEGVLGLRTGWKNDLYNDLLTRACLLQSEKRKTLLYQAEEILMEEMPIAPLFFPTHCYLKNSHLKNVILHDMGGIDFKYAYFR